MHGSDAKKLGKTETIKNNLSPEFTKTVTMDYFFEQEQVLKFTIADDDDGSVEIIGQVLCTLGEIMGSQGQTFNG